MATEDVLSYSLGAYSTLLLVGLSCTKMVNMFQFISASNSI